MSPLILVFLIIYTLGAICTFAYILWSMTHEQSGNKAPTPITLKDIGFATGMSFIWPVSLCIFL